MNIGEQVMNKGTHVCLLLVASLVYGLAGGVAYGQETSTDTFDLSGTVMGADDMAVGEGFTVSAVAERLDVALIPFSTRADGTYDLRYLDSLGRTIDVGDSIRITVTEDATGKEVGGKTYIVTEGAVTAALPGAMVDLLLSGILVEFNPSAIDADGVSQSTITVTVQGENEQRIMDDTLTITPEAGKGAVDEITNNGDGTYTTTYTAPSLALMAPTTDTLTVRSAALDEEVPAAITLQVVQTVVTVMVDLDTFRADSTETAAVTVMVARGPSAVADETITLVLTRDDGGTDTGTVGEITNNGDGSYTATYTPAKTVGRITLTAMATQAGESDEGTITISAGPPANLMLTALPETVSSEATSIITATVTDVAGNGVGGLELSATTSAGGTLTSFAEVAAAFGVYTTTYMAPTVEAEGSEEIVVTIGDSEISAQTTLNLTPPPRMVNTIVVTGFVHKKAIMLPVAGVDVTVTIGKNPSETVQTSENGLYDSTVFAPLGVVAARTGDFVSIVVTDEQGVERGRVEFALTNENLGEEDSATVERDVPTNIDSTTTLTVSGIVFLEDGLTSVPGGLSVSITNNNRNLTETVVTAADGTYSIGFSADTIVAETDDMLTTTVTNTDESTFEVTSMLTTDEVETGGAERDVMTDFIARERQLLVVEGMVFLEDGETPARAGLEVVVTINDFEETTLTEEDSTYQVVIFDLFGAGIVAQTGDTVDVEVTALDEDRVVGTAMDTLLTAEVTDKRANVNVTTDLTAKTNLLVVEGAITNPDGSAAEAGLSVTVMVGERLSQSDVSAEGGTYSITFFDPLVIVAETHDMVEVQVIREATGETAIQRLQLKSKDVVARRIMVDVKIPPVLIDVVPSVTLRLDTDGSASTDLIATVTKTTGELVTDVEITASIVDGIGGSVTPVATNNGDGTYTVTYSISKAFGTETVAITSSAVGSPTETVEIMVIDDLPPIVVAIADSTAVSLDSPVMFDGRDSTDNVEIATFSWDFDGDGIEDSAEAGPVTFPGYSVSGVYTATLTVTDTAGNEAVGFVDVAAGGLGVRGAILEADEQPLETDDVVRVNVTHTRLNFVATDVARSGRYTVAFTKEESDQILPGDELQIDAVSTLDPSDVLSIETITHILAGEELESSFADASDIITNRTSTYTIRGRVRDMGEGTISLFDGQSITISVQRGSGEETMPSLADESGSYEIRFRNYLTNPVIGEEILVAAEIPGEIPRRGMVTAFFDHTAEGFVRVNDRVAAMNFDPLRIGGLSLNTWHYRNFIDRLVGLVGGSLGSEQVIQAFRGQSELRQRGLLVTIAGFLPPAFRDLVPEQMIFKNLPLIFEQPGNIDLENFGNAVVPSAGQLSANSPVMLVGHKLDLYAVVPTATADRVTFTLNPGTTIDGMRIDNGTPVPHLFQLEEEQAITFLPSYLGLRDDTSSVFSRVTMRYATRDLPAGVDKRSSLFDPLAPHPQVAGPIGGENLGILLGLGELLGALVGEVLGEQPPDAQPEEVLGALVRELLGELSPGVQLELGELVRALQGELPPGVQLEQLEEMLLGLVGGLVGELSLGAQLELGEMLERQGGSSFRITGPSNILPVAPPGPAEYIGEVELTQRDVGDDILWEAQMDLEPGKIYYYYYAVELVHPVEVALAGLSPGYQLSRWVMPDPRNPQIDDLGLLERLITPEVQVELGPFMNSLVSAFINGEALPTITSAQLQRITNRISANAAGVVQGIINSYDAPIITSLLTVPVLDESESVWVAGFEFDADADGEYELDVAVFQDGLLMDQLTRKRFTVDRMAPEAESMIGPGEGTGLYQDEDGTYIATVLPSNDQGTLDLRAIPLGDQSDLFAYLHQVTRHMDDPSKLNVWVSPPVESSGLGPGFTDLFGGVPGVSRLIDQNVTLTFGPPHQLDLLLSAGTNLGLPVGEYGIRAIGLDNVLNIGSNTPPVRLDVVPPDADRTQVTFVVIGDCNYDGDTTDLFESGPAEGMTIFSNTTDIILTVEVIERTDHPLVSIMVQFKAAGDGEWQDIAMIDDIDDLKDAEHGSRFDVNWSIEDFGALIEAGDGVMVRAVATNALSVSDGAPEPTALLLDPDVCPVEPDIVSIGVLAEEVNPDSRAARGNITIEAFTGKRTAPAMQAVRFEIRRLQDEAWEPIGEAMESMVVESAQVTTIIEDLIGSIVDGSPSAPIAQYYQRWAIPFDTTTLEDTITADSPAARDASQDENPWVVRGVAIDVNDTEYPPAEVKEEFSVDNIDDVAPLTGTEIDVAGAVIMSSDGTFTVGGVLYEGIDLPVLNLTAQPAADPETFDLIELLINMANPDGTLGDAIGEAISFSLSDDGYTATVDLTALENRAYIFQALAIDDADNQEERDASFAITVNVENFRPPEGAVLVDGVVRIEEPTAEEVNIDGASVADISAANPGGFPVAEMFIFTVTLPGVTAVEIDVLIDGVSAKAQDLVSVDSVAFNGRQFTVTVVTSKFPDGIHTAEGVIAKPNGTVTFTLPLLNVDNTAPIVTVLSPAANDEVSALPTVHAIYADGIGGGVDPSDASVVVELVRLVLPDEVPIEVDPSTVSKDQNRLVYTRGELLPGGAYRVTATITDTAGNTGEASRTFTVVRTLPAVSILSPLSGQVLDHMQPLISAVFTGVGQITVTAFTIDDTAVEVTPEMVVGNRLSYTPPDPGLTDASHTVTLEITDADGNPAQSSVTFTVSATDATPPIVTEVSPKGLVKSSEVILSADAFDAESGIESITLSIDVGGSPVEGPSPLNVADLTAGGYAVVAVVKNGAGLEKTFVWSFTVELDTTPPVISVVAPQGIIREEAVAISAVVTDEQSDIMSVTIALDGGEAQAIALADIQSGQVSHNVTELASGTHTVTIVASSGGGSSSHTWTFTVEPDTTPPVISHVGPQGVFRARAATVTATVTDEESEITSVTISHNGGEVRGVTPSESGDVSRNINLTSGLQGVEIVATSAGGTSIFSWRFIAELDTTAPSITHTAPHGTVRIPRPTISVSASDDLTGVSKIEITLTDSNGNPVNGREEATPQNSSIFSSISDLKAGTYTVDVIVTDRAKNSTATKWNFTVVFDTVPPSITIVAPQSESRTNERKPPISATYTDNISGIDLNSVKFFLDGNPVVPDKVSTTQVIYTHPAELAFGRHTVKLEVADLATPVVNRTTQEWSFIVEDNEGDGPGLLYSRNFPNPFTERTTIAFTLSRSSKVTIEIYDMTMRLVKVVTQDAPMEVGKVKIEWDGKTEAGDDLARGVYFCQIIIHNELRPEGIVLKMAVIR
jgi:PKD repeat protein